MLQLAQSLGLDLTDTFARDRELLADFFQRVVGVQADAEAQTQHALLARRERGEHARRGCAQVRLDRSVERRDRVRVVNEISALRIILIAYRSCERQRLLGDLENLAYLLLRHA